MSLDTSGLVLFHNYRLGHAVDQSGNSNSGTLTNSEGFIKTKNGWGYFPQTSSGYISVADSSELQLTQGTWVLYGNFTKGIQTYNRFLCKRDAGGTNYELRAHNSNTTISIYDGASQSVYSLPSSYATADTIIVTKSSGDSAIKVYINGVYSGAGTGTCEMTANDAPLIIGNYFGGSQKILNPLNAVAIYNTEKTATEVAAIHNEIIKLKTVNTGTKRQYLAGGNLNDANATSVWQMKQNEGKVNDIVSTNHGTVEGTMQPDKTPWGASALRNWNNSTTDGINCGSNSSLNYTTDTFGGYAWVRVDDPAATRCIFGRGSLNTSGYGFFVAATGKANPNIQIYQSGATQSTLTNGAYALANNIWYLVGFVSVAADKNYIYVNGQDRTLTPQNRTDPATHAGNFYIGKFNNTAYKFLGSMGDNAFIGSFSSKADYEAAIQAEYNRVANLVIYEQDFEAAAVTQAAIGSGTLPGTDCEVIGGTFKISTDTINGKTRKVIECVTAGQIAIPNPQGYLPGLYEFYVNKANNSVVALAIAQSKEAYNGGTQDSYNLYYGVNEQIGSNETTAGSVANKFNTADDYAAHSTWHKLGFSIQPYAENTVTTYLNDTVATAIAGINPYTDVTLSTAQWMIFDVDAGDKIALIEKRFGVEI